MLLHGDCLERLRELPACSVDACVTDPPYGLSFMGKKWDYDVPGEDIWRECLRVLKPGGHLLAFAGTRTQHRMAVRIEDAGFEIRDMIAWCYGSGFPKSLDVSKAIDRAAGAERAPGRTLVTDGTRGNTPNAPANATCADCGRQKWGKDYCQCPRDGGPATPEAQQWEGWGTALKPALEPITVARKPFKGNVAANVLEHGTGAINIEGCRVGTGDRRMCGTTSKSGETSIVLGARQETRTELGRWPANLIHDGSDEVTELFPQNVRGAIPGTQKIGDKTTTNRDNNVSYATCGYQKISGYKEEVGSAARFFYCAKASKADREDGNGHPTVKPTDLMRYLCRLVTPPGGIVLDPFMGSGSTGKAAVLEGFRFIGIEREAEYIEIARGRIQVPEQVQEDLF
jgi:DNA modification methylase